MTLFLQLGTIGDETRRRTVGIRGEDYYCIIELIVKLLSSAAKRLKNIAGSRI